MSQNGSEAQLRFEKQVLEVLDEGVAELRELLESGLSSAEANSIYDFFGSSARFHLFDAAFRAGAAISRSGSVNGSPFLHACSGVDFDRVRWFSEHGANVNEVFTYGNAHPDFANDDLHASTPLDMAVDAWISGMYEGEMIVSDLIEEYLKSCGAKLYREQSEAERERNFKG